MKRISTAVAAIMALTTTAVAQETYENARLATETLDGTARYVGMGGAMDALGADLSTISTNPAGIGLFRRSQARISFGFTSLQDAQSFAGEPKTKMSFDQAGFVYAIRKSRSSFINFAFNYHKSTDFSQILSAAGALHGASQNKLSYMKGYYGVFRGGTDMSESNMFSQIDYLNYSTVLQSTDASGNMEYSYLNANQYLFNRAQSGYIGAYDINISGNINDRVYLGLTFGIRDVNYSGYSEYSEALVNSTDQAAGTVVVADDRTISGTGFNIVFGAIFRPIADSPLRFGLSVATPTWYDLTTSNYTQLLTDGEGSLNNYAEINERYDFKLFTPWKFGLSVGTTVGNYLALGLGYEYADYGNLDSRINDGSYYDYYYDTYYEQSSSDRAMNNHTDKTLKGVSTLKVGAELKPDPSFAIRLGYNYVSPMYNKLGFKDYTVDSYGTYYSSSTDYTNWKSTNRITCGAGYTYKNFTLDVAYQYSVTSGDFKPFSDFTGIDVADEDRITVASTEVNNKRHQMVFTLGYTF